MINAELYNGITNICKKRNFYNIYYLYKLNSKNRGNYLNTWFIGNNDKSKKGYFYNDELYTFKKVDNETANHLCRIKYNPISINILCPTGAKFKFNNNDEPLYNMKAMIWSIDDASFGIWWDEKTLNELELIRVKLIKYINSLKIINGELFLQKCIELNADEETVDYN